MCFCSRWKYHHLGQFSFSISAISVGSKNFPKKGDGGENNLYPNKAVPVTFSPTFFQTLVPGTSFEHFLDCFCDTVSKFSISGTLQSYNTSVIPSQVELHRRTSLTLSGTMQLCQKAAQTSTSLKQDFAQPTLRVVSAELEGPCFSPVPKAPTLASACQQQHIPTAHALSKGPALSGARSNPIQVQMSLLTAGAFG